MLYEQRASMSGVSIRAIGSHQGGAMYNQQLALRVFEPAVRCSAISISALKTDRLGGARQLKIDQSSTQPPNLGSRYITSILNESTCRDFDTRFSTWIWENGTSNDMQSTRQVTAGHGSGTNLSYTHRQVAFGKKYSSESRSMPNVIGCPSLPRHQMEINPFEVCIAVYRRRE
ncbi:hypothetical protein OG21DRAFT_681550 [Imleria badia]|nr:hypothetical protein OG21DRAFT_681550 [Imleria badia]